MGQPFLFDEWLFSKDLPYDDTSGCLNVLTLPQGVSNAARTGWDDGRFSRHCSQIYSPGGYANR